MDLQELQRKVVDSDGFDSIEKYFNVCREFLCLLNDLQPTRIISPTAHNYVFFQFSEDYGHKITRPLNVDLYIEESGSFETEFEKFVDLLDELRKSEKRALTVKKHNRFLKANGINRIIYTIQQSIGSIGDSFPNANQSRKRVGMLFEQLVKHILLEVGLTCVSKTISIPLAEYPLNSMSYELDLVISRGKAIVAPVDSLIKSNEIVGSVKTTSKDRIDKVFMDKYMMSKLLGRPIPVIAIFLPDVQRARKGGSIFGVNSTFKSNHFLGYTYMLNRLDGVYYVDPRPNMVDDAKLSQEISDFGKFLTRDLWNLVK